MGLSGVHSFYHYACLLLSKLVSVHIRFVTICIRQDNNENNLIILIMEELETICNISVERMLEISAYVQDQMDKGLKGETSDLKMLPSFVDSVCSGMEQGYVMALDMGGSNVRVTTFDLRGNGVLEVVKEVKHAFPPEYMSGTASQVFGFLADCIKEANPDDNLPLGFTFSFPSEQTSINHSKLVIWTKGFSASGCVGEDTVELLERALMERNLHLRVTAICNDTVGTLISRSYSDPKTAVGIILGTGCNAAYMENVSRITKTHVDSKTGKMIINMECGATGDGNPSILPQTPFDLELDPITPNPGHQRLEKMMSGFYLGELTRRWSVYLYNQKQLFKESDGKEDFFTKPLSFDSKYCSVILGDDGSNLEEVDRILNQFHIVNSSLEDRKTIKSIVHSIVLRSARLMASFVHAIYAHMGDEYKGCTVGVDGSVYKYMPHYQEWVNNALEELGRPDIDIGLADDGSCIGAALVAFGVARG